jgi:hypothetical protein
MFRLNVSDAQLLPLLLPGFTLSMGLSAVLVTRFWTEVVDWLNGVPDALGIARADMAGIITAGIGVAVLCLFILSLFFGAVLAIICGFVEGYGLDSYARWKLELSEKDYQAQWRRYLDHLEEKRNPYVSKFVDMFQFELRFAFAILMVAVAVLVGLDAPSWVIALDFLISVLFFLVAMGDHRALAEERKSRFGGAAVAEPEHTESETPEGSAAQSTVSNGTSVSGREPTD